jgi:hypothetical protein
MMNFVENTLKIIKTMKLLKLWGYRRRYITKNESFKVYIYATIVKLS